MSSLVTTVSRVALAAVAASLLATGAGTAALLHHHALRDVDQLLLVGAQAGRAPDAWQNGHYPGPVTVEVWDPDKGPIPAHWGLDLDVALGILATEMPVWVDQGDERVLFLAVEPQGVHDQWPPVIDHPHGLRMARCPHETAKDTIGRFLFWYGVVAFGVVAMVARFLPRWLRWALAPLEDTRKALEGMQGVAVRTRLPEGGPFEVARLVQSVNALLDRLEAAVSAQTRFAATAAHELRTPVALLQGELELALRRPRTTDEYRTTLSDALDSVGRLARLVEGVMALTRIDSGRIEEERRREYLSALVSAAVATERPTIEAAGGQLSVVIPRDVALWVHVPLFTAALGNLLRNCARHAPGTLVALRVVVAGDIVHLLVDDDGPGIAPGRGLAHPGIGLRVVDEVVRRHGGTFQLGPRPGGGARAEIRFPYRADAATIPIGIQGSSNGNPR